MKAPVTIRSSVLFGTSAVPVTIEARETDRMGLWFETVSELTYGEKSPKLRELKTRVRAALKARYSDSVPNAIVRLRGDIPKVASIASLDLPVALALHYHHVGYVPPSLETVHVVGELSLDGCTVPVRGLQSHMRYAESLGRQFIGPDGSVWRPSKPPIMVAALSEAIRVLDANLRGAGTHGTAQIADPDGCEPVPTMLVGSLAALGDALAGGARSILLVGPPGVGKTMLAIRATALLPSVDEQLAEELHTVACASGLPSGGGIRRPFRAPHHTISDAGLLGNAARPGEVSLAHGGVLFLDELPEFRRTALDSLSAVLNGVPAPSGAPAKPALLIASANPCPCGYHGMADIPRARPWPRCVCNADMIAVYAMRGRAPLRFDHVITMTPAPAPERTVTP